MHLLADCVTLFLFTYDIVVLLGLVAWKPISGVS